MTSTFSWLTSNKYFNKLFSKSFHQVDFVTTIVYSFICNTDTLECDRMQKFCRHKRGLTRRLRSKGEGVDGLGFHKWSFLKSNFFKINGIIAFDFFSFNQIQTNHDVLLHLLLISQVLFILFQKPKRTLFKGLV